MAVGCGVGTAVGVIVGAAVAVGAGVRVGVGGTGVGAVVGVGGTVVGGAAVAVDVAVDVAPLSCTWRVFVAPGPTKLPEAANWVPKAPPRPKLSVAAPLPDRVTTNVMTLPLAPLTFPEEKKHAISVPVPSENRWGGITVAPEKIPTQAGEVRVTTELCWTLTWTESVPASTPAVCTVIVAVLPTFGKLTDVGLKLVEEASAWTAAVHNICVSAVVAMATIAGRSQQGARWRACRALSSTMA